MRPVQTIQLLSVLFTSLALSWAAAQAPGGVRPDRYCLSCLCTAATGCDVRTGCVQDGADTICGPFYMSEPYWKDADLKFSPRFAGYDFKQCASDAECAGEAVSSYMHGYSRDCDGDGRVTCRDFGLMHYMGYTACGNQAQVQEGQQSKFYGTFTACVDRMAGLLARENYITPPGYAPNL